MTNLIFWNSKYNLKPSMKNIIKYMDVNTRITTNNILYSNYISSLVTFRNTFPSFVQLFGIKFKLIQWRAYSYALTHHTLVFKLINFLLYISIFKKRKNRKISSMNGFRIISFTEIPYLYVNLSFFIRKLTFSFFSFNKKLKRN